MNETMLDRWLVQSRKGFLELCVLLVLRKKDQIYGLELLHLFEQLGLTVNEGTLYPLLNRMHKNGWLESTWEMPADRGHPRRFYALTPRGRRLLPEMLSAHYAHIRVLQTLEKQS